MTKLEFREHQGPRKVLCGNAPHSTCLTGVIQRSTVEFLLCLDGLNKFHDNRYRALKTQLSRKLIHIAYSLIAASIAVEPPTPDSAEWQCDLDCGKFLEKLVSSPVQLVFASTD